MPLISGGENVGVRVTMVPGKGKDIETWAEQYRGKLNKKTNNTAITANLNDKTFLLSLIKLYIAISRITPFT